MARINSDIKKRFDGKRVYTSNEIERIPLSDSDIFVISNETTRLDALSLKYYKRADLWWVIAKANDLGFGYVISEGMQIRIPFNIERYI